MPKLSKKNNKYLLQEQTNQILKRIKRSPSLSSLSSDSNQPLNKVTKMSKKGRNDVPQKQKKIFLKESPSSSSNTPYSMIHEKSDAEKLRDQILNLQHKLDQLNSQNVPNVPKDIEIETIECSRNEEIEDNTDSQLFGKFFKGDEMVHLQDGIYCRKRIYDMATGLSYRATHVARRLLEGVFKEEAILVSTFTGQPPKSQGKERQMQKYTSLNASAKNAIIDFSTAYALKKGWIQQNKYEINRALSQKVGEIKRCVLINKKKNQQQEENNEEDDEEENDEENNETQKKKKKKSHSK